MIAMSDEFIFLDDVQYTRRDWRSRNRVKSPQGLHWLSVPVSVRNHHQEAIQDVQISEPGWNLKHWKTLQHFYRGARCFGEQRDAIEALYVSAVSSSLSEVNRHFVEGICAILGVETPLRWSREYTLVEGKSERLLSICQQAGAGIYLSGPSARGYLDVELFARGGVEVEFMDYGGYPAYPQLYPPYEPAVSVLDLLFCMGKEASGLMRWTSGVGGDAGDDA